MPAELLNVDTPLTTDDNTYTFNRDFDFNEPDPERLIIQQLRSGSALTSGTGTYTPFLRQNATGTDLSSQGFNTSDAGALGNPGRDAGLDMDGPTTAIRLRDIPVVIGPDGQAYYEIRLDLNEENNNNNDPGGQPNRLLELSEFQLYWSDRQATTADYNAATYENRAIGANDSVFHRVFDIDASADRSIILRDSNAGSGQDDYIFLIPVSTFAGASPDSFITLFSQFGPNPVEGATFEEWRIRTTTSISGTKFNDADGQGDRDPTDLGLGGFTIQLFQETNGIAGFQRGVGGDALVTTTVSATNGSFTFFSLLPGTYYIDEINQPGWTQTTGDFETIVITTPGANVTGVEIGNFNPIDISGRKMIDTNGNGVLDPGENTPHGMVTIFIDLDDSGTLTLGDLTTVTAADGTWAFNNLAATAVGHRVYENVGNGFVTTIGAAGIVITGDATDLLFANFALGRISGTKSEDIDGQVGGDQGAWTYGPVTIQLVQNNVVIATTQTDASGNYSFGNLLPGQYVVREMTPTGSVVIGAGSVDVNGQVSGFDADVDFANFRLGRIAGTKTEDLDGIVGGTQGAWTYGAVTIQLVQNNVVIATTQTDASGNYAFEGLLAGTYQVREVTPAGSVVVGLATVTATGTTMSGFNADVDFSNVRYGTISGTKTEDLDGIVGGTQGTWTYGAVTIQLVQNNIVVATTQTDASGNYSFGNLLPGSYIVREVTPTGSVVVGSASVDASGQTTTSGFNADVDFANFRLGRISGTKTEDLDGIVGGTQGAWTYGAVTIQLVQNNVVIATTQTDASGNYAFEGLLAGTYQVREVTPAGSVVVGLATVTATGTTMSGFNADVDFSNVRYGTISGTKTEDLDGLVGGTQGAWTYGAVTIQLVQNNVVIATTQTDASGNYSFGNLLPGSYIVREVTPTGSVAVSAVSVDATGQTSVSGFNADVDFSNVRLGRISGTKTEDLDGIVGGTQGAWTYGAVTIELVQNNVVIATTQTDGSGNYAFEGLLPGSYIVREVTPTGSVAVGSATIDATGQTSTSGFNADVDFANFRLGRISGTKTEDLDGQVGGAQGAWTYGAVTIQLVQNNVVIATTQTDASGNYAFEGLLAGTYQVREVTPAGTTVVGLATVTAAGTTTSGFNADVDFSNFRNMEISGFKWADLNNNRDWDEANSAVLGGWTIVLDRDNIVGNGNEITTTVTAANGSYSFNIGAVTDGDGVLYVYELQQSGFTQTFGNFSFNIQSGLVIRGDLGDAEQGNFGNHMMSGANRTPGFWQSTLGQSFYNGNPNDQGDANGDGIPDGNKDFSLEGWSTNDLLLTYGVDSNDADTLPDLFRVWDGNNNGMRDTGDFFLTRAQLLDWVSGGSTSGRTFADILRRDVAAAFLNTLNNDAIGGNPGGDYAFDPQIMDSYMAAIQFINTHGSSTKKSQSSDWSAYGSVAHIELAAYNENGEAMSGSTAFQIRMDGDDYSNPLVQGYLRVQNAPPAQLMIDDLVVHYEEPVGIEIGTSTDFFL